MPAIPPIRHTGKPSAQPGGPLTVDTEFAGFLAARRSNRILSRDEWIARHHHGRPSLLARLLRRA